MPPRPPKSRSKPDPGEDGHDLVREQGLRNAGLRPALADRIDRFIVEHPELGINYRNEFAGRACEEYLAKLERRLLVAKALKAVKESKMTPLEALRKVGVKLNEDDDH